MLSELCLQGVWIGHQCLEDKSNGGSRTEGAHPHYACQSCRLEQVERFMYLGAIFTERGDSNEEIRTHLGYGGREESYSHSFLRGKTDLCAET